MSLVYTIRELMQEDDEDDSDRLEKIYDKADAAEKRLVDNVLICLCGYGFDSIKKQSRDPYTDDSDDAYALASAGHGTDEDYGSASEML